MKMIEAEGGTLVGIHRADLAQWSGGFGKRFFGENSPSDNDYDALFEIIARDAPPTIGVLRGSISEVCYIVSEPLPTFIAHAGSDRVYIAQIDTSEEGWSKSQLCRSDFEKPIDWKQNLNFSFSGGEIIFFDSAGNMDDISDDCLKAFLAEGVYTFGWARQEWEGKANLIFIRLMKQGVI